MSADRVGRGSRSFLRPCSRTTSRPGLLGLVVDGGGAEAGGGVRVAPRIAAGVGLHNGPVAVRRARAGPAGAGAGSAAVAGDRRRASAPGQGRGRAVPAGAPVGRRRERAVDVVRAAEAPPRPPRRTSGRSNGRGAAGRGSGRRRPDVSRDGGPPSCSVVSAALRGSSGGRAPRRSCRTVKSVRTISGTPGQLQRSVAGNGGTGCRSTRAAPAMMRRQRRSRRAPSRTIVAPAPSGEPPAAWRSARQPAGGVGRPTQAPAAPLRHQLAVSAPIVRPPAGPGSVGAERDRPQRDISDDGRLRSARRRSAARASRLGLTTCAAHSPPGGELPGGPVAGRSASSPST